MGYCTIHRRPVAHYSKCVLCVEEAVREYNRQKQLREEEAKQKQAIKEKNEGFFAKIRGRKKEKGKKVAKENLQLIPPRFQGMPAKASVPMKDTDRNKLCRTRSDRRGCLERFQLPNG